MKDLKEVFEKVVCNPMMNQLHSVSGYSSEYPAAPGGLRAYWDTLCIHNGWKLQKNYYFDYYRILDDYNVIRALCPESEMVSVLESIASRHN